MRNVFPGTCYICGDYVKAGEGFFTKGKRIEGRRTWKVKHAEHLQGYVARGSGKEVRNVKHYKNHG